MAAAVADFRPVAPSDHKIKKGGAEGGPLEIEFERTTDILASLVGDLRPRVVVGFAMETKGLVESARAKLEAKDLDLIVANDLTTPGAGFGTDTNVVVLLDREGGREDLPRLSKEAVASRVLDRVAARLQ